ncbi:MAG: rhodanese-like domain-containing protein [Alkaliphilus sp.]
MNFKRNIALLVALVMVFALVGCGEKDVASSAVVDAAEGYFANYPDDKNLINEKAFVERLQAGEELFILDIRATTDYEESHPIGAVHVPWKEIGDNLDKLPADQTIYVLCYSGQTAGQTIALLNVAGFDAKSVRFGMVRGVSKQDGFEDIMESGSNDFPSVKSLDIDADVKTAIAAYFQALKDGEGMHGKNIVSAEAAQAFLNDDSVMFLSIRRTEDFEAGHIPGASHMSFGKGMQENFGDLPKDKTIIVYCYSGQTSGQTVAILRLLGFDAISLHSGMGVGPTGDRGWANEGYATESK